MYVCTLSIVGSMELWSSNYNHKTHVADPFTLVVDDSETGIRIYLHNLMEGPKVNLLFVSRSAQHSNGVIMIDNNLLCIISWARICN